VEKRLDKLPLVVGASSFVFYAAINFSIQVGYTIELRSLPCLAGGHSLFVG
jgi:hypothetical protein